MAPGTNQVAAQASPQTSIPFAEVESAFLAGHQGTVYGPVSGRLTTPISFVIGPHGSGRTSFLLTLAGRMHPKSGHITTLGVDAVKQGARVRRLTGIAGFDVVDQLEGAARVDETLHERLAWLSPWYRRTKKPSPEAVHKLLAPTFGSDIEIPSADQLVRTLDDLQDLTLRIGLARLEHPRLILIDDIDQVSSPDEREQLLDRLAELSDVGLAFIVGTADERDIETVADLHPDVLRLGAHQLPPAHARTLRAHAPKGVTR